MDLNQSKYDLFIVPSCYPINIDLNQLFKKDLKLFKKIHSSSVAYDVEIILKK